MEVSGGFILGFDTDPGDIFDRQIRFIQDAAIPTAMVGLLTALPQHPAPQAAPGGRAPHRGLRRGNNTHDLRLNFVPRMDLGKLLAGYKRVLSEIYKPDRYFARCLDAAPVHEAPPHLGRRIRVMELRAFLLSLLVQTFSSTLVLLEVPRARASSRRPRMLAETVTMAVKGHHFFKMTRNVLERGRVSRGPWTRWPWPSRPRSRPFRPRTSPHRIAELTAYRDRVVRRMHARYRRIHRDFRVYADDALAAFQATMEERLSRFANEYRPRSGSPDPLAQARAAVRIASRNSPMDKVKNRH